MSTDETQATMDGSSPHDPTAGRDPDELRAAREQSPAVHKSMHRPARGADLTSDEPGMSVRKVFGWFGALVKPRTPRDTLGNRGENVAAKFLRNLGYKIIERNFRCPTGEIDIIARDGGTLVFVEVKTRQYDDPAPEEQVNHHKRHQNTKAAKFYLTRFGRPRPPARFDVVAVVWPNGQPPIIRHTTHAFEGTF